MPVGTAASTFPPLRRQRRNAVLPENGGEGAGTGTVQDVVAHGAAGKAHHLGQSVQRYFLLLARATQLHLHLALFQAALAHDDLHGPADEVAR